MSSGWLVFVDARIPVVFGAEPGALDACWCRRTRRRTPPGAPAASPAATNAVALDRLFLQRVRGEVPWFTRVVVAADDPQLRADVTGDPVLSARFRLA